VAAAASAAASVATVTSPAAGAAADLVVVATGVASIPWILDEVDAPLDDANVGKFTNMIRQFSENSQFIIVTHNKMTMSTVDVIYGVTMQEPGVSKLVTVDFRSLQQN
jgi:ABC-type lipoprotein export system ATPase subunit